MTKYCTEFIKGEHQEYLASPQLSTCHLFLVDSLKSLQIFDTIFRRRFVVHVLKFETIFLDVVNARPTRFSTATTATRGHGEKNYGWKQKSGRFYEIKDLPRVGIYVLRIDR
jgi:hypothetical protein